MEFTDFITVRDARIRLDTAVMHASNEKYYFYE